MGRHGDVGDDVGWMADDTKLQLSMFIFTLVSLDFRYDVIRHEMPPGPAGHLAVREGKFSLGTN